MVLILFFYISRILAFPWSCWLGDPFPWGFYKELIPFHLDILLTAAFGCLSMNQHALLIEHAIWYMNCTSGNGTLATNGFGYIFLVLMYSFFFILQFVNDVNNKHYSVCQYQSCTNNMLFSRWSAL